MIRIVSLGRTRVFVDETEFPQVLAQKQRFAILLYVATVGHTTRETLKSLFWGSSDDDRAGHALSQSVYELRRLFGEGILVASGNELTAGMQLGIDIRDFYHAVDAGRYEDALAWYGGPFLQDFALPHNSDFNTWADGVRAKSARLHRVARRECCRIADARGDPQNALSIAQGWVEAEPSDDEAHHTYIELLARLGHPREALSHYSQYAAGLEREGLEPLDETTALVDDIRTKSAEASPNGTPARSAARPLLPTATAIASTLPGSPATWSKLALIVIGILGISTVFLATYFRRSRTVSPSACAAHISAACSDLDSTAYVVLPFASQGVDADADGFFFANAVSDVLAQIEDVQIVDRMRVIDAVQRVTASPRSRLEVDSSIFLTRRLRSRYVILGEVQAFGDSLRVVGTLYDVAHGPPAARTVHLRLPVDRAFADGPRQLIDSLLARNVPAGVLYRGMALNAGREFARGEAALAEWDLPRARTHFARAAELDPDVAHPYYRLAQVMMWQRDTTLVWRDAAMRAYRLRNQLAGTDTALASALYLRAVNSLESACNMYRSVIAVDSLSFLAWYGLADCLALDNSVVADPGAPSGRAFRTSYNEAIRAYERALQLAPSFNTTFRSMALSHLSRMFFINYTDIRYGREQNSGTFIAGFPLIMADTVGLLIFPFDSIDDATLIAARPAHTAALLRNRSRLRQLVVEWTRATPSWNAYAALAGINERTGLIRSVGDAERSALDAIHLARKNAPADSNQLYLQATEVRLLLKLQEFGGARLLADSLAHRTDGTTVGQMFTIASALALLGHVHRAASTLNAVPVLHQDPVSAADHRRSLALAIYAAFGAPHDSVRSITATLERRMAELPISEARFYRERYMVRPAALAFHNIGPTAVHRDAANTWPILTAQSALVGGDRAAAHSILDQVAGDVLGDQIEPELAHAHIALRLQLGDTLTATRELDQVLGNLAALDARLMHSPTQSAGFVNLIILRARLAYRSDARRAARYWARQALALISGGDLVLRTSIQEMQRYSQLR